MNRGVAVCTDRLEILKAPGVIVEVGLTKTDDEWTHKMVDLVARSDDALLHALLAKSAIPLKHLLTDASPARIVIDKLVAAVIVAGRFLWFGFRTEYSWHSLIGVRNFTALALLVTVTGDDGVVGASPALGKIIAWTVGGHHLLIGGATMSRVVIAKQHASHLPYHSVNRLLRRFLHRFCPQIC